jgi:hypothetical protein
VSVYFATCRAANAVKIGSSVDPWGRLPEIQAGCPLDLVLEAILPGGIEEEFSFHARFSDDRIRGEWFVLTETIEMIIAANPPSGSPVRRRSPSCRSKTRARLNISLAHMADLNPDLARQELVTRISEGDICFPFRGDADLELPVRRNAA